MDEPNAEVEYTRYFRAPVPKPGTLDYGLIILQAFQTLDVHLERQRLAVEQVRKTLKLNREEVLTRLTEIYDRLEALDTSGVNLDDK